MRHWPQVSHISEKGSLQVSIRHRLWLISLLHVSVIHCCRRCTSISIFLYIPTALFWLSIHQNITAVMTTTTISVFLCLPVKEFLLFDITNSWLSQGTVMFCTFIINRVWTGNTKQRSWDHFQLNNHSAEIIRSRSNRNAISIWISIKVYVTA